MKLNEKTPEMDFFRKKCRENNLSVTPQRLVIFNEMLRSKDHPNADVLFKRVRSVIPDISLDTVNRTLLTFSKIGIISVVEGYGEPRRFDPVVGNHHHFRCISCNTILDFDHEPYADIPVPENINKRNQVLSKKVLLEGYCSKCSNSR